MAVILAVSIMCLSFGLKTNDQEVILRAGSGVSLETIEKLYSDRLLAGQLIDFRVTSDVLSENGEVVIPAGSLAKGQVMRVERAKGVGKAGFLEVQIKSVNAVDGTKVSLTGGDIYAEGEDKQTLAIVLGIFICILFLTIKGENAFVPSGYAVTGAVATNTRIQI